LPYRIEYSPSALEHLRALKTFEARTVLDSVDQQLQHHPAAETRNRKPMRPNPLAPWELRIGNLRVYYEIDAVEGVVRVLAVGLKQRSLVRIGKETFEP
jgi:mRNA-degrading endonuclease RelE of RelBE toxin-antitoxin system